MDEVCMNPASYVEIERMEFMFQITEEQWSLIFQFSFFSLEENIQNKKCLFCVSEFKSEFT